MSAFWRLFWLAKNTSIYPKQCRKVKLPVQNLKLAVQNVKLAVQYGEIVNGLQAKFVYDKQNGGQKRDKVWTYAKYKSAVKISQLSKSMKDQKKTTTTTTVTGTEYKRET